MGRSAVARRLVSSIRGAMRDAPCESCRPAGLLPDLVFVVFFFLRLDTPRYSPNSDEDRVLLFSSRCFLMVFLLISFFYGNARVGSRRFCPSPHASMSTMVGGVERKLRAHRTRHAVVYRSLLLVCVPLAEGLVECVIFWLISRGFWWVLDSAKSWIYIY